MLLFIPSSLTLIVDAAAVVDALLALARCLGPGVGGFSDGFYLVTC